MTSTPLTFKPTMALTFRSNLLLACNFTRDQLSKELLNGYTIWGQAACYCCGSRFYDYLKFGDKSSRVRDTKIYFTDPVNYSYGIAVTNLPLEEKDIPKVENVTFAKVETKNGILWISSETAWTKERSTKL